jgi:hypothetical protein
VLSLPSKATAQTHRLLIDVEELEIARGHDGLLRGAPEPVLILAAYLVDETQVRTLGRALHRFAPRRPFPSRVAPDQVRSIAVEITHHVPIHIVVLALALEEDSSRGVQAAFGAVEHHGALTLWQSSSHDPTPMTLGELTGSDDAWRYPAPVHVLAANRDMAALCDGDKWVAGVAWVMHPSLNPSGGAFRLPFQSADRRNDWTALVTATSHVLWPDPVLTGD